MADELVAFLRARLDEDEQTARAAAEPERWAELNRQPRPQWYVQLWADPDRTAVIADPESSAFPVVVSIEGMDEGDAQNRVEHIARHDPARVLREVEAKRRLLDDIASDWEQAAPGEIERNLRQHRGPRTFVDPETGEEEVIEEWTVTRQLRLLALPYADHPDYQERWRP